MLQFRLPEGVSPAPANASNLPLHASVPPTPMISDREFTLSRGISHSREARRRSSESLRSGGSSRSGKSQADRLISAMQEPSFPQRSPSGSVDSKHVRFQPTSPPVSNKSQNSQGVPMSPLSGRLSSSSGKDPLASLGTVTHTPPSTLQTLKTPPTPGTHNVTDSGVPISAVRVSERGLKQRMQKQEENSSYFPYVPADPPGTVETISTPPVATSTAPTSILPTQSSFLNVLVAEDDPINAKIVQKRLTKVGHTVELTGNGEACANAFCSNSKNFDIVLMDIQMPIADGYIATERIREHEANSTPNDLSEKARQNARIPIFAVSASLVETERQKYIDIGFDGWLMKPINFDRVNILLKGISDLEARKSAVYQPGDWEIGGWFDHR